MISSLPMLATVTLLPLTSPMVVSSVALSLDHLNVALASELPVCISTLYSWFSSPLNPELGFNEQGSFLDVSVFVRAVNVPLEGLTRSFHSGKAVLQVAAGVLAASTFISLTCHTVCSLAVVSASPSAISWITGLSR